MYYHLLVGIAVCYMQDNRKIIYIHILIYIMTSTWRKQETMKDNSIPSSKTDHFSNIPMFDVLHNKVEQDENPIVEGFDWEGIDYFHHRGVYELTPDSSKIREYIEKLMSYLSSPVTKLDSMVEGFIYDMLIAFLMLNNIECNNTSVSQIRASAEKTFFWAKKQMPKEGFSLKEQPYLIKTIDSFEKNHKDFVKDSQTKQKMGSFYIKTLNAYETRLRRRMTDDELFLFNNDFDNLLNDPAIQKKITGILPTSDWKSQFDLSSNVIYENTEDDYKKYYDSTARFKMNNTDRISYFSLKDGYFPLPQKLKSGKNDMEVFEILLSDADDSSTMLTPFELVNMNSKRKDKNKLDVVYKNKKNTIIFTTLSKPPSKKLLDKSSIDPKDGKYVFSVNVTKPTEQSIEEYLSYVIKRFSMVVYSNIGSDSTNYRTFGFQELEARVGTIYTNLLNRLEFLHYSQYQEYLDSYRMAIFNHMFYVFIQQSFNTDYATDTNVYVAKKTECTDIFKTMIDNNNIRYSLVTTADDMDSLDDFLTKFPSVMEKTADKWAESDYTSKNFDDGSLTYTSGLDPITSENKNDLLGNYILNNTNKSKEMEKYFIPGQMSECERTKRKMRKELSRYAKIIKNEIYRILLIPVVLYVVYNIYYMFFFRDVDGQVKDDKGNYINIGNACKNPIFPDWEGYFHSYDNHNTDLILEYVFKPAKIMYTWLNAIKAMIRLSTMDRKVPPYLWLFSCVLLFYHVFNKYGAGIMKFYNDFYNTLTVPFVKIMKVDASTAKTFKLPKEHGNWAGFNEIAIILTIIFCCLSAVKDIGGLNWHEILQRSVVIDNDIKEPYVQSWMAWVTSTPTFIIMFFKSIVFLLYWIFKYYVAFAMVPFACFIAVIYITYNLFFAVYNNTNSECDYSTKMELIDRIIYTKLYDVPKNPEGRDYIIYILKSTCWLVMFFMTELLSIYVLAKGLDTILKNITGSTYADGLKTFLFTFYVCIFVLIGLWCVYKYKIKFPIQETFFSNEKDRGKSDAGDGMKDPLNKPPLRTDFKTDDGLFDHNKFTQAINTFVPTGPISTRETNYYNEKRSVTEKDSSGNRVKKNIEMFNEFKYLKDIKIYEKWMKIKNAKDKRFTLKKDDMCDTYEVRTENKPIRILLGSDILTKIIIKEEIEKTKTLVEENKSKPSFTDKWSNKIIGTMGSFGDTLLQKGQNMMEKINTPSSDGASLFDTAKSAASDPGQSLKQLKTAVQAAALPVVSGLGKGVGAVITAPKAVLNSDTTKFIGDSISDKGKSLLNAVSLGYMGKS